MLTECLAGARQHFLCGALGDMYGDGMVLDKNVQRGGVIAVLVCKKDRLQCIGVYSCLLYGGAKAARGATRVNQHGVAVGTQQGGVTVRAGVE